LQNQLIRTASTPATNDAANDKEEARKKETDEVQLRRDGALNQFISELSSNIHGRRYSEAPSSTASNNKNINKSEPENDNNVSCNSNENVTESNSSDSSDVTKTENSTIEINDKVSDNSSVAESERKKSDLLAKPSHFVTVIEVKEPSESSSSQQQQASLATKPTTTTSTSTSSISSFKAIRSGYENVIIENNKRNSNLMNEMSDRSSNTTSFNSVRPSAPIALLNADGKKKIPPR
jgi:hypothetical protein